MAAVKVLLDTHTLLWWFFDDPRLSDIARQTTADPANDILVSSASAWEVATKFRIGKLPEAEGAVTNLPKLIRRARFQQLSITLEHALVAGLLPGPHRDPFDRMLIAQSQCEDLAVITNDQVFSTYDCRVIW